MIQTAEVMSRRSVLWFSVVFAVVAAMLAWRLAINRHLAGEAGNSVSGEVKSILLCALISNRMPTQCSPLDGQERERAVNALRQGSAAEAPGHGIRENEYMLKIVNATDGGNPRTECFVLVEYAGFAQDLYLLPIRAGENCAGDTFNYSLGSIKVKNFLHSREGH
jgi:hypothetical protein